jgi:hypothetical protein
MKLQYFYSTFKSKSRCGVSSSSQASNIAFCNDVKTKKMKFIEEKSESAVSQSEENGVRASFKIKLDINQT